MDEMVKFWFQLLYEKEIENAKVSISNEHLWELGYDGEDPNPHTENIERLKEYIEALKEKLEELQ